VRPAGRVELYRHRCCDDDHDHDATPVPADMIRVDIASGCPATVAGHPRSSSTGAEWIWNPDPTDLDHVFVPGTPTSAVVCRYSPLITPMDPSKPSIESGGDLAAEQHLDAFDAVELASLANDIEPSDIAYACMIGTMETATYIAVAFSIPGRSDVDLWLKDWISCPELSNGVRSSGELVNGLGAAFLDRLAV
jgi:hypothetical protein